MLTSLITFLQTLDPLIVEGIMILLSAGVLLCLGRLFGKDGLYLYTIVGVIVANLQALKATLFLFYPEPIALGSTVFTSLFICSELLNEYYGETAAKTAVKLGFVGYFLLTLFILVTLGYQPVEGTLLIAESHYFLEALFKPAPSIFLASMIAYLSSQWIDIKVFRRLRQKTHKKHLWLRGGISTILAIAIDNTIFSLLAWYVFAETPYDISTIFYTYIVGVFWMRCLLSLCFIPILYAGRKFLMVKQDKHAR